MQRYGITIPFDGIPLADQRDLMAELPDLGYTGALVLGGGRRRRVHPAGPGQRMGASLRLGTAIAPVFTAARPPWPSARPAWPAAAPGRVAIGIGASSSS